MQVISPYDFFYNSILQKQYKNQILLQYNLQIERLFSTNDTIIIENYADFILQEAIQRTTKKYNIISEQLIYQSKLLFEEIDIIYEEILLQGWFSRAKAYAARKVNQAKTYATKKASQAKAYVTKKATQIKKDVKEKYDTAKKFVGHQIDKAKEAGQKLKKKAIQGYNKAKTYVQDKVSNIKSTVTAAWNKCKEIANVIWDKIKQFGQAVVKWIKALLNFFEQGYKMLGNASIGGKCGYNSPDECITANKQLTKNSCTVAPFYKSTIVQTAQKVSSANKQAQVKLQKDMANGGNIDKKLDAFSQSVNKSLLSVATGCASKMEAQGKNFNSNQLHFEKQSSDKNDKKSQTNSQSNSQPQKQPQNKQPQNKKQTQKENKLILQKVKYDLKQFILQNVYRGITPKMIYEQKYNINSVSPQNDIIIANSKLSFKTINGYLVCQQTNMQTNDTIIYQSNELFKGHHLIFEQTENKLVKNDIINQDIELETKQIISQQIKWGAILMWGLLVVTGVVTLTAIIVAIKATIAAATAGLGALGYVTQPAQVPVRTSIAGTVSAALTLAGAPKALIGIADQAKTTWQLTVSGIRVPADKETMEKLKANKKKANVNDDDAQAALEAQLAALEA